MPMPPVDEEPGRKRGRKKRGTDPEPVSAPPPPLDQSAGPVSPAGGGPGPSEEATPARSAAPGGPSRKLRPKGGRSQVRAQLRQVERLRLATLAFVVFVLLGSLPGFFLIKYATQDPGFMAMDALELPGWAARNPVDQTDGSRWCFHRCRWRHRVWESQRAALPTLEAYRKALREEGWKPWEVAGCPPRRVRGLYSCWRRDSFTLDLWIRPPECRRGGDTDRACPVALVTVVIRNAGADARLQ